MYAPGREENNWQDAWSLTSKESQSRRLVFWKLLQRNWNRETVWLKERNPQFPGVRRPDSVLTWWCDVGQIKSPLLVSLLLTYSGILLLQSSGPIPLAYLIIERRWRDGKVSKTPQGGWKSQICLSVAPITPPYCSVPPAAFSSQWWGFSASAHSPQPWLLQKWDPRGLLFSKTSSLPFNAHS